METDKKKQMIKLWVAITILVIIFLIVIAVMIKYEVEGDQNMPFILSKIDVISTAEGVEVEGKNKWNFNIFQNNDLYFYIDKNENYAGKDTNIKEVRIENIKIEKAPLKGEIKAYMPNSVEGRLYNYNEEYTIDEKLTYRGGEKSNPQTLEIGAQGGSALIRFSNVNLGTYTSDKDKEIVHDGTLLKKLDIQSEEIKFEVSFDFIIEVTNHCYKANIKMELPYGDIMENGTESFEKVDTSDVVFKRVN